MHVDTTNFVPLVDAIAFWPTFCDMYVAHFQSFICFRHVLGLDCVCNKSWTKTTLMVLACRIESKDKATAGRTQDAGQQPQKSQMVNI